MKKLPLRKLPLWVYRIIIACAFGAAITFSTLSAGRTQLEEFVKWEQGYTRRELVKIKQGIDSYQNQKHKLPHTLDDLVDGTQMLIPPQYLEDGWHRPFLYKIQGTQYTVSSYGQDGKPGGTGLDTDLTTDNLNPKSAQLSLFQFYNQPKARSVANGAGIAGLLAVILSWLVVRPVPLEKRNILPLIFGLCMLFVAITAMTAIMTQFHIPSGH